MDVERTSINTAVEEQARAAAGRIYVVVPVFNRISLTMRFLGCMREQTFRNFDLVVVDDGSSDGTSDLITKEFEEVHLLRGDGNLWWTGAINVGIRHALKTAANEDAILVINDDVEVAPDYLSALYKRWRSCPGTLIGSVVVDIAKPGIIIDGGRTINWWTAKFTILNSNKNLADFPEQHCVDVSLLTGWGTLIPVSALRRIGLYNDRHFQQCGDTELSVRANNAGFRLMVSYAAVLKLHLSATDRINSAASYSLRDLKRYFFDVKSNCRLKYRFFFILDTASNPFAFASCLLFDFIRITGHFVRGLRLRANSGNPGTPIRKSAL